MGGMDVTIEDMRKIVSSASSGTRAADILERAKTLANDNRARKKRVSTPKPRDSPVAQRSGCPTSNARSLAQQGRKRSSGRYAGCVESTRCVEEAMLRSAGREATAQAARKGPSAESTCSTGEPPAWSLISNQRFKIAPPIRACRIIA